MLKKTPKYWSQKEKYIQASMEAFIIPLREVQCAYDYKQQENLILEESILLNSSGFFHYNHMYTKFSQLRKAEMP